MQSYPRSLGETSRMSTILNTSNCLTPSIITQFLPRATAISELYQVSFSGPICRQTPRPLWCRFCCGPNWGVWGSGFPSKLRQAPGGQQSPQSQEMQPASINSTPQMLAMSHLHEPDFFWTWELQHIVTAWGHRRNQLTIEMSWNHNDKLKTSNRFILVPDMTALTPMTTYLYSQRKRDILRLHVLTCSELMWGCRLQQKGGKPNGVGPHGSIRRLAGP